MKVRTISRVGAVAALAAVGALAPAANAGRTPLTPSNTGSVNHVHAAPAALAKLGTCIDQSDDDTGIGETSQNFEAAYPEFDSRGADDFTLTKTCRIKMVMAEGRYFNGSGPARSENVTFYRNYNGLPGGVISNQMNLIGEDDGSGNFTIMLSSPVGLRAGTYWVSVQANLDYDTGGQWGWNTNSQQRRNEAAWRNKGDGFGTGCVHYTALSTCLGAGQGSDFSFMLHGSGPGSH